MASEIKKEIELEIAYVLFVDIVGYSKLLINEQRRLLELLNEIVRGTDQFKKAEANHRLITIPTGDGMALVFYNTPEAPVECALEISRAVKEHPELKLRMGVHSGPVSGVIDVGGRANVAGAGINLAQRVMDCGDAEHILLSKHVAEDLEQLGHWHKHLHDLGQTEVKHGANVSVVNLYTSELGNPEVPQKFLQARHKQAPAFGETPSAGRNRIWIIVSAVILIAAIAVVGFLLSRRPKPAATANASSPVPLGPSEKTLAATSDKSLTNVPDKSIAVLPFENLSDEKQNAFFTDGVQDEILTHLAKIADLKVISRTSVMQYKTGTPRNLREIAQQLGVAHLVEGSVQRVGNKVRVNAQLIDARNDTHLWAQTYDRDLADVFAIQSEIAKAIADQLQAKLSPVEKAAIEQRPTSDVVAFDLYTRAKALRLSTMTFNALANENLVQAVELLNQAVARDPTFFLAWCELAATHDRLYFLGFDHSPAQLALAETAVEKARNLRPDAGETHLAVAQHRYRGYRDYDGARAEIAIAQKTLPNDPLPLELLGFIDRRQGRWDESTKNLERAIELDPRNFYTLQQISLSYLELRRFAEMAAVLDRAHDIVPNDVDTRVARALVDLRWRADTRPLRTTINTALSENPSIASTLADTWLALALCERDFQTASRALAALGNNPIQIDAVHLSSAFARGLVARAQNDHVAAEAAFSEARTQQQKLVREQPDYGPGLCVLGLIDAALGKKEDALREGRRALELLPVTKDSINGAHMIEFFAITCAWAGEKDLAMEQLTIGTQNPSFINYGELKLHPYWDPLRGDPRFERIVSSLAPKQ
ncbi:MAG: adenylate/guanylate cyclase domain-containing protein [Chthoniobacterales bacterium]